MARHPKIMELNQLSQLADRYREEGLNLVLCHGTFDLLHVGHIRHLQTARRKGDKLFVTLTADAFVSKGPGRPVFTETLRAESLSALACVDHVAVVHEATALAAIDAVKPHIYAKGSDYQKAGDDVTGNILREKNAVSAHGGRTIFTDDLTFSSSKLLNEHFSVFSDDTRDFLNQFQQRHSSDEVLAAVAKLRSLKVCVVGDAIVDEYHYTDPMGQTGKGNILAALHKGVEKFAGGALAVANHVAGFCDQVTLVTGLGRMDDQEEFICSKLAKNVETHFFYRDDAPTVRKVRFVDRDANKLFEVYHYEESLPPEKFDLELGSWLAQHLGDFDVVLVPDFGNGLISQATVDRLVEHSRFLALNTQVNSGNRGFHTVNRYKRADFISLNEPELRLALHNRTEPLETVAAQVARNLGASFLAVTLGTQGLWMLDSREDKLNRVPALSIKVVDRIGAGDAFLSLAGIALGGGINSEVAAFVGAVAAALDVQIVCNREPVDPIRFSKYVTTLLK